MTRIDFEIYKALKKEENFPAHMLIDDTMITITAEDFDHLEELYIEELYMAYLTEKGGEEHDAA